MSNDQQGCCIIEVCCGDEQYAEPKPPVSSPKQIAALAQAIQTHSKVTADDAQTVATYLCGRFDFAPKGSLKQLKDYIRKETLLHPVYNSGD